MATILIVDDAEFLRMRISRLLAGQGYDVLQADNGRSAVKTYRPSAPVTASRTRPVACSTALTVAPGTTAPELSVTIPLI